MRALERSFAGCPVPWVSRQSFDEVVVQGDAEGCAAFSQQVLAQILQSERLRGPAAVILSADWQDYAAGAALSQKFLAEGMDETLTVIGRSGARVLVIGSTPHFDHSVPACVARLGAQVCRVARARHEAQTRTAQEILVAVVSRHPHARLWDPAAHFCDASFCVASRAGVTLFRDREHLSRAGAESASAALAPQLDWLIRRTTGTMRPVEARMR